VQVDDGDAGIAPARLQLAAPTDGGDPPVADEQAAIVDETAGAVEHDRSQEEEVHA
jgi:hypothetical protein